MSLSPVVRVRTSLPGPSRIGVAGEQLYPADYFALRLSPRTTATVRNLRRRRFEYHMDAIEHVAPKGTLVDDGCGEGTLQGGGS